MDNRPLGREKHITGAGKEIRKQGSGLHTGPVGRTDGMPGGGSRPNGMQGSSTQRTTRSSGTRGLGGGKLILIAIIAFLVLGGGGAGLSGLLGGSGSSSAGSSYSSSTPSSSYSSYGSSTPSSSYGSYGSSQAGSQSSLSSQAMPSMLDLSSLFNVDSISSTSTGWSEQSNTGSLDKTVDSSAREKRTVIKGNGKDTVTIMLYMCGTDLESRSGMATNDLKEILAASLSDKVNILIYSGGCKQWKNNVMSSSVNQIYKVENGGLRRLVDNDGSAAMTKPATLTGFINYCAKNYPANRNMLIFWDHGGGSLSGYGYDEKYPNAGGMTLKGINEALDAANVTFDFIGFDACLMATLENALTLTPYADYLIASEETEPGIGWYYTNWLTALSKNTSMPTLEIGKNIVDDFVKACDQSCRGQKTTLSVIDLAELESTVPDKFREFAADTAEMLQNNEYKAVSDARSGAREFASSSRIDQVDLVDLVSKLDTEEGDALAKALLGAVKYNRTSSNMTNAYGLSIYFPYQKAGKVSSAVATYDAIGIDSEYSKCIEQFAAMESGGQAASGASGSPLTSLMGSGSSLPVGSDMLSSLLFSMMSGGSYSQSGRNIDTDSMVDYLSENRFDASSLVWTPAGDGYALRLSESDWSLVHDLELNVFYDDGEGYIDLGCDNVFEFTDDGALLGEYDGTWLAVNDQPVSYYYVDTVRDGDAYTITGRIPVLLNGSRADLIVVFSDEVPYGYIAGARSDYRDGETETIVKGMTGLEVGDEIVFLCDYYSYDGQYQDSYVLADPWIYDGSEVTISNVYIDASSAYALYRFTDIYCQQYWTEPIPGHEGK